MHHQRAERADDVLPDDHSASRSERIDRGRADIFVRLDSGGLRRLRRAGEDRILYSVERRRCDDDDRGRQHLHRRVVHFDRGAGDRPARGVRVRRRSRSGASSAPAVGTGVRRGRASGCDSSDFVEPTCGDWRVDRLDTWLWCVSPGEVHVAVALRGWTAEATLDPVEFAWTVGGLDSARFRSSSCGSEDSPAGSWMPQTLGGYSVTLTSTWAGSWTLAYNGVPRGRSRWARTTSPPRRCRIR